MSQAAEQPRPTMVELLERVKEGDQIAWKLFFDDAYPKVRRIIRRKLNPRMRRRCDSVDIANSVMADFCAKVGGMEFPCYAALQAYLIQAAEQKLIDEYRKQHGLKRNIDRDTPVENAFDVAGGGPTPSRIVEGRETYDRLLASQPPLARQAVTMKAQGDSTQDISDRTGMPPRAIQRLLQKLRISHRQ